MEIPYWLQWFFGIVGTIGVIVSSIALLAYYKDKRKAILVRNINEMITRISTKQLKLKENPSIYKMKTLKRVEVDKALCVKFHEKTQKTFEINDEKFLPLSADNETFCFIESVNDITIKNAQEKPTIKIVRTFYRMNDIEKKDNAWFLKQNVNVKMLIITWDLLKNEFSWEVEEFRNRTSINHKIEPYLPAEKINILNEKRTFLLTPHKKLINEIHKKLLRNSFINGEAFSTEVRPYILFVRRKYSDIAYVRTFSHFLFINDHVLEKSYWIKRPKKWRIYSFLKFMIIKKSADKFEVNLNIK